MPKPDEPPIRELIDAVAEGQRVLADQVVDKEALFSAVTDDMPGADGKPIMFEIPGGLVQLRPLSRIEALQVGDEQDTKQRDVFMLFWGVVDPDLTMGDVREWQKRDGAAGVIEDISQAIGQLTGMLERDKKIYARFRGLESSGV